MLMILIVITIVNVTYIVITMAENKVNGKNKTTSATVLQNDALSVVRTMSQNRHQFIKKQRFAKKFIV